MTSLKYLFRRDNGVPIPPNIIFGNVLNITNPQVEDTANYTCSFQNVSYTLSLVVNKQLITGIMLYIIIIVMKISILLLAIPTTSTILTTTTSTIITLIVSVAVASVISSIVTTVIIFSIFCIVYLKRKQKGNKLLI